MTTAFQTIFNLAESISIDRRGVVGQTISRSNIVRSVDRGGRVWRFTVKMPDGIPWTQLRSAIEAIENADMYTVGTVNLNNSGYNGWLSNYRGSSSNLSGWTANATQGSDTLTSLVPAGISSGTTLAAGDFVQLGTLGHVYSVVDAVPYGTTSVKLNRPVVDTTGSKTLIVGPAVTWQVICTQLPTWTIFSRNQVSWSGNFVFYESML